MGASGAALLTDADEALPGAPGRYARHRPEQTLLYQVITQHYPAFLARLTAEGRTLPRYVQGEFEAYLKCGLLEHGFMRVRCTDCHREKFVAFSCKRRGFCPSCGARRMVESAALLVNEVLPAVPMRQWVLSVPFPLRFLFASDPASMSECLGIVFRAMAAFQIKKARLTHRQAQCGAITLIQRFGSALNLNIHYHMLVPDGVYLTEIDPPYFRNVPAPTAAELQTLVQTISERIGRRLERTGKLVRDEQSSYLALESEGEDALKDLHGNSIQYRIAVGPHKGRQAFKLQSLPPLSGDRAGESLAKAAGFSLHAGVAAQAHQRNKLERVARYITRPPVAIERLSLTPQGNIKYSLKTPYRDGTTHVIFEPLDFIARLASLVPSARVNLTRYHGVFAPHARLRAQIVPSARGDQKKTGQGAEGAQASTPRHVAMTWAQRLKRVFLIDVSVCEHCGGAVKIIACIEDQLTIRKILEHVACATSPPGQLPPARGPPDGSADLFG
jgi:ribosomal protein S27E